MRKTLNVLLLTLALGAMPVCARQSADRVLVVEVKEAAGRPIKHACVTVVPKEGEILFDKTDSKGRIRFRHLAAGSYRVVVKVDGYEAQKREVVIAGAEESAVFSLEARGQR